VTIKMEWPHQLGGAGAGHQAIVQPRLMSGGRRGGQGRQFPDFSGFLVLKSSLISQINSQGIMSANATRVLSSYWRMPRGVLANVSATPACLRTQGEKKITSPKKKLKLKFVGQLALNLASCFFACELLLNFFLQIFQLILIVSCACLLRPRGFITISCRLKEHASLHHRCIFYMFIEGGVEKY
jgi:hypothetical protein